MCILYCMYHDIYERLKPSNKKYLSLNFNFSALGYKGLIKKNDVYKNIVKNCIFIKNLQN